MNRRHGFNDPTGRRAFPEEALEQVLAILQQLSQREARILSLRFGLLDGQPKTLDEIGKSYGVTRERIRQIEGKGVAKLRELGRGDSFMVLLQDGVQVPARIREKTMLRVREVLGEPIGTLGQRPLIACGQHGWTDPDYASNVICGHCPCPVGGNWSGRPRKYCSDACKQAAYRARRKGKGSPTKRRQRQKAPK